MKGAVGAERKVVLKRGYELLTLEERGNAANTGAVNPKPAVALMRQVPV